MKKKGIPAPGIRLDKDGRIVINKDPRDTSQARSWAKGGRKRSRAVSPAKARLLNTIKGNR